MIDKNKKQTKGTLLPGERALEYLRKQFVQSAKLQGRIGNFHQVLDMKIDGTDKEYNYKDSVIVAYHLNENPSRKFLTRYGWFTEDMESLPIILTLTYNDIEDKEITVEEGAIIELSGKQAPRSTFVNTINFMITDVRTDLELNQAICKISPVRAKQKEKVKVLATADDPILENQFLNRKIYYTNPDSGGTS